MVWDLTEHKVHIVKEMDFKWRLGKSCSRDIEADLSLETLLWKGFQADLRIKKTTVSGW